MTDLETPQADPLTPAQVDRMLDVVDDQLGDFCAGLAGARSPAQLVLMMTYALAAVFATHPHLYGEFVQLLAAFQERYEALLGLFKAQHPREYSEREDDEVFFILPSYADPLPPTEVN